MHREVQAWLHIPGARPHSASTRDVSLGGLFLVGTGLAGLGEKVVVGLSIGNEDHRADFRLQATVARIAGDGVGLSFECFDLATIKSLRDELYGAASLRQELLSLI